MLVVKVFSVSLTWLHVVVVLMVLIVEIGITLMELDCLSMHPMLIPMSFVGLGGLTYVVVTVVLTHQLVSIDVIFQLLLSMMLVKSQ